MNDRPSLPKHLWRNLCAGRIPLCMVVALLALWLMTLPAGVPVAAQEATPAPAAEPASVDSAAAGAAAATAISADEVNAVARELWCPLCSGVRLDSCELKACDQMKEMIAIKLAEGEETQSIVDYFVAQYGPQVLGQPPLSGFNWLAWILPVLVVIGGGAFVLLLARRMVRPAPAGGPADAPAPASEYDRKLDEELSRYE